MFLRGKNDRTSSIRQDKVYGTAMLELVGKRLDLFNSLAFLLLLSFSLRFTTQLRLFGKNGTVKSWTC